MNNEPRVKKGSREVCVTRHFAVCCLLLEVSLREGRALIEVFIKFLYRQLETRFDMVRE